MADHPGAGGAYVFADAEAARERERLALIERRFDPRTRRLLREVGVGPGAACLEIGPGTGSILRWMAEVAGPGGRVVGLDLHPEGVADAGTATLLQGDVVDGIPGAPSGFDVVHARYVLVHVSDPVRALDHMVRALKPGGWLVVEEPDFAAAGPAFEGEAARAVERVNEAILRMYRGAGKDPRLGLRLPALVERCGLAPVEVEVDLPLAPGGSDIALIMGRSAEHLAPRYAAAGPATEEDVRRYVEAAADPACWASWYATCSVRGRRP